MVRCRARGARVCELGVRHLPRTAGRQSGLRPSVVVRASAELLRLAARARVRGQRPLDARLAATALSAQVAAAGATVVVAAARPIALRLSGLGRVAPDPFYDAAVRWMGTSWHDFLFGALEPGGSVAIDKPAVALWPQVLATQLLGFDTTALLLPGGARGPAGVGLLYRLARDALGARGGAGGGGRARGAAASPS